MNYKRKQMVCDLSKPDEKELHEWLETKKHGFFSVESKLHWLEVMRKEKEDRLCSAQLANMKETTFTN